MKIILATNNPGKIKELKPFFPNDTIYTFQDFNLTSPSETGKTYLENALIKARFASEKTKLPAIADDSGLEIDYLNRSPGLLSARFFNGEDKIKKILTALKGVPFLQRTACFRSVLVFLQSANDPTPKFGEGIFKGIIAEQPAGNNGFGYDPIFYLPEYKKTVAQLPINIKQQISHRVKALKDLFRTI